MQPGDTFFLISNGSSCEHLFVVVSTYWDNETSSRKAIFVNFTKTSSSSHPDSGCIFSPNEVNHPFIQYESYIAYRFTTAFDDDELTYKITNGIDGFRQCTNRVSDQVLERIKRGSITSLLISEKQARYYHECS